MKLLKLSLIVSCLVFSSILPHEGKSCCSGKSAKPSSSSLVNFSNVGVQVAAATFAGAAVYGMYKGVQWLMEPENRSFRALDNAKAEIIECNALLLSLAIDMGNPNGLDEQINKIASRGQDRYLQVYVSTHSSSNGASSSHASINRQSTSNCIQQAILEFEHRSRAINMNILQIDYCLKHYTSDCHEELKAMRPDLVKYKEMIDERIIPGLKKHMHGMLVSFGYKMTNSIANGWDRYVSQPLHPIF